MSSAEAFAAVLPSARLQEMGLSIDGAPFNLARYPYLIELFEERPRYTTILKGGQMGFTSWLVLDFLIGAKEGNLRGVGIYFPSHTDANDFARARVDPMLRQSALAGIINDTDTIGLKMIGRTQFYMRGAGPIGASTTGSKSPVKSIPLDWLGLDEKDEMLPSRVDAVEHRLDGSTCPRQVQLSTPTLPNYGVDLDFQESDQRHWFWRCPRCDAWVCLEEQYPDCIALPRGEPAYYLCSKCREPLQRQWGRWVPKKTDVQDHYGYHISQMCSPTRTAEDIRKASKRAEARGMPREFHNQVLARSYAEIGDVLTKALLDACCGDEPRRLETKGPCAMGVDLGRHWHHYWIKERLSDTDSRTVAYGKVQTMDEIHGLAKRFNVRVGIVDQTAETHTAREFIESHSGWWGAEYATKQPVEHRWDEKEHVVKIARTAGLDASAKKITRCRECLPMPDETYRELVVPQMCNLGRSSIKDPETGAVKNTYVLLGKVKNDHLRHAHVYATVAEERAPLASSVSRARAGGRRPKREFLAA